VSLPRRLVPRQTHSVTRRVTGRRFLLRPTQRVNAIVLYALGVAQRKAPHLLLHAFLAEANHTHGSVTDSPVESELPDFERELNSLTARALNAHYGRGENLWSQPGSYDNVEVHNGVEGRTLEEQLLYLWTNPVRDGLVARPEDWPGVRFLPEDFGRTIVVPRPDEAFFGGRRPADWEPTYPPARRRLRRARRLAEQEARRQQALEDRQRGRGRRRHRQLTLERERRRASSDRPPRPPRTTLPDEVTVTITRPPGYDDMTLDEVRAHFRRLLDEAVAEIHAERERLGLTHFMGAEAVLAQNPHDSAGDTFPTFARNPRIAGRGGEGHRALLRDLQRWRVAYREALEHWQGGNRSVEFPHGAYWLPCFHGANVAPARDPPSL
jgi:hypothetical protein